MPNTAKATVVIREDDTLVVLPRARRSEETDDVERLQDATTIAARLGVPTYLDAGEYKLRAARLAGGTP